MNGTTAINTTGITTSGAQTYTGLVTLGANTVLTATTATFGSTLNGARTLGVTGNAVFNGLVGNGQPLQALSVSGTTAINAASVTTSNAGGGTGDQTYVGAVTAGAVTFAASNGGNIDLSNAANDFTGAVAILSAKGVTLRDVNALSLAGVSTSAGQVFVAGGNLTTTDDLTAGDTGTESILLQSTMGAVTLGAGTVYTGGNITVAVGPNQSFINQTGIGEPFKNNGGRTLVFSTETFLNTPSSLNAGLTGFQPYFNQTPLLTVSSTPGVYSVGNALPSGNLTVYSSPFSDNIPGGSLSFLSNTEAYQAAVPIGGYSLVSMARRAVQIKYQSGSGPRIPAAPRIGGMPEKLGGESKETTLQSPSSAPAVEAKGKIPVKVGNLSLRPAAEADPIIIGDISIDGFHLSIYSKDSSGFLSFNN